MKWTNIIYYSYLISILKTKLGIGVCTVSITEHNIIIEQILIIQIVIRYFDGDCIVKPKLHTYPKKKK